MSSQSSKTATTALAVLTIFCMVALVSGVFYGCVPCIGDECNLNPGNCPYGIVRDPCGRLVCAAGPGERCGGRDFHLGKCGEGLSCKCGKCRGCSIKQIMNGRIDCDTTNPMCQ
ncbi:neuroparsin-A-like [Rhodnius prolixus]|uniref:Neuroparsin 1 n=1 Tax=Rhodnius prolixus TaxID=13249 RepID=D2KEZ9_RHOPR|nr:neuroparsin 1 precursor [Rhodnius prolixus]